MTQDDTRREKARLHKSFWDNQCHDLNAQRKDRRGIQIFRIYIREEVQNIVHIKLLFMNFYQIFE